MNHQHHRVSSPIRRNSSKVQQVHLTDDERRQHSSSSTHDHHHHHELGLENQSVGHSHHQYWIIKSVESFMTSTSIYSIQSILTVNRNPDYHLSLSSFQSILFSISLILSFQSIFNHFHLDRLFKSNTSSYKFSPSRHIKNFTHPSPISSAICLVLDHFFLFYATIQLSVLRIVILTIASSSWSTSISDLAQILVNKPLLVLEPILSSPSSLDLVTSGFVGILMLITCFVADLVTNSSNQSDLNRLTIGYLCILGHLLCRGLCTTNYRLAQTNKHQVSLTHTATAMSLLLSLASLLLPSPRLRHSSPDQGNLEVLIVSSAAYSIINYFSTVNSTYELNGNRNSDLDSNQVLRLMVTGMIGCELAGKLWFDPSIGNLSDRLVGIICYFGISSMTAPGSTSKSPALSVLPSPRSAGTLPPSTIHSMHQFIKQAKSVIKTILKNPESRNIYFFLCLNLAFMVVQMMYGIWTNSLGLISDSIHMFFDCMALGMGLFASVMATWPADKQFTYGYGRVETLSGFANGVFLMLISVFIIFEAIQRLVDPPEMNTKQLLAVSTVGLGINLIGMFATGHHHHHGHCHSHGHDHDHGHSHNMKGVFLHVMADTLGSVGVIISTLLIERYGWTGFDPIASIFIAVLIFASVVPLVQDSARVLVLSLDQVKETEICQALGKLSTIEGLSSYSAPRFWPKDPATISGSLHLQLTPAVTTSIAGNSLTLLEEDQQLFSSYDQVESVKKKVQEILIDRISGLTDLTLQVEGIDGSRNCFCLTTNSQRDLAWHK